MTGFYKVEVSIREEFKDDAEPETRSFETEVEANAWAHEQCQWEAVDQALVIDPRGEVDVFIGSYFFE